MNFIVALFFVLPDDSRCVYFRAQKEINFEQEVMPTLAVLYSAINNNHVSQSAFIEDLVDADTDE